VAGFSGEWNLNYSNFDYGISNNNTDMNNQRFNLKTCTDSLSLINTIHHHKNDWQYKHGQYTTIWALFLFTLVILYFVFQPDFLRTFFIMRCKLKKKQKKQFLIFYCELINFEVFADISKWYDVFKPIVYCVGGIFDSVFAWIVVDSRFQSRLCKRNTIQLICEY
jgi:hypothetical protein